MGLLVLASMGFAQAPTGPVFGSDGISVHELILDISAPSAPVTPPVGAAAPFSVVVKQNAGSKVVDPTKMDSCFVLSELTPFEIHFVNTKEGIPVYINGLQNDLELQPGKMLTSYIAFAPIISDPSKVALGLRASGSVAKPEYLSLVQNTATVFRGCENTSAADVNSCKITVTGVMQNGTRVDLKDYPEESVLIDVFADLNKDSILDAGELFQFSVWKPDALPPIDCQLIAPKPVQFFSLKLRDTDYGTTRSDNRFWINQDDPKNSVQPFELGLINVDKSKPLFLGVVSEGQSTNICDSIVTGYNAGKIQLEESWWGSLKGKVVSAWGTTRNWLGGIIPWFAQDSTTFNEGTRRLEAGQWLAGGAQATGSAIGKLLFYAGYGIGKGAYYLGKGIVVTVYDAGKATVYQIIEEWTGASGQAKGAEALLKPGTDNSSVGIPISQLMGSTSSADDSKYLFINAKTDYLYIKGDAELAPFSDFLWRIDKIDGLDVNPTNFKDGKEVTFFACQFKLDQSNPANPQLDLAGKDVVTVKFGKSSCSSLLDCLLSVDNQFLNFLFPQ